MQQRWEAWIGGLEVGVIVHNAAGEIVYTNAHAQQLLGHPSDELRTMRSTDAHWSAIDVEGRPIAGEDHPAMRVLATGEAVRDVVLGVARGGAPDRVWLLISATPFRGSEGALEEVLVSFTDVTAAQRAVQKSEATYRSVIRAMSEGVAIHNPDGSIREANAAAERVLGLSVEQLSGRSPLDPRWRLVKPDGSPVEQHDIPSEITQATGEPCENVLLGVHRPNGERAWLSVSTDPLREPGSTELAGVVATFTDVTAEREVRLQLEASRAKLQRVIDAQPGVVFQSIVSAAGEVSLPFVGGRVETLLGVSAEMLRASPGMVARMLDSATQVRLADVASALGKDATRDAVPLDQELLITRPDGETRWVRAHAVLSAIPEGRLFTGVLLDVTQAHAMADALRSTQRREVLGELAAGVAHNFNNLLAVILPNVEMASAHASPDARELLDEATVAARNAADLVRQMLAFGRRGTFADAAPDATDLVPLVHEAVRMCRRTFDKAIAIDADVRADSAFVQGVPGQLQQVVLNLILNARDAVAHRSSPALRVRLDLVDGYASLSVSDNGVGMSEDVRRRAGEPFFTTKSTGSGTGLGLASAFATIRESHGRWMIESTVDVGTTITIDLPVSRAPDRAPATRAEEPASFAARRVLLVDDEAMVRRAMHRQLASLGVQVEDAPDGASALSRLARMRDDASARVDLLVLDLSMPGLSGRAVLQRVVSDWPTLPVIVVSGDPGEQALPGARAVLQKPVSREELAAVLREVFSG